MIIPDESLFLKRTSQTFRDHKRRAKAVGHELKFTLDELRQRSRHAHVCPYCNVCLTTENFSADHRMPLGKRVGEYSFTLANLEMVCRRCNECKSILDHDEFRKVMTVVLTLSPQAQASLFARLRAGNTRIYGRKR